MKKIVPVLILILCHIFFGCKKDAKSYPIEIVDRNVAFSTDEKSDPLLLVVTIEKDGKVKLNNIETGTINNLEILSTKLEIIFKDREKTGLDEKEVLIDLQGKIKKKDLDRLIAALKNANANPIRFIKNR